MKLGPAKTEWVRKGEGAAASGQVPQNAPFFQDHFPGFPVLPGVLSLEILKQTADLYLKEFHPGKKASVKEVSKVKFSSYLRPGDAWESQAKVVSETDAQIEWDVRLMHQGRAAASARMIIQAGS